MYGKTHKVQLFKFGLYGFLKNLIFFEPYLYVYFTINHLSLGMIGVLFSIKAVIVYVFEIPSGVIADRFGKKTELVFCFSFYIVSFIIFFLGANFGYYVIAMVFFGLGEAFRSGTHKAMIMQYLDKNDIETKKSKIYGRTRSFSLLGSMFMSLLAVVFVIWLPDLKFLFLLSIVPYLIDMLMILTYPKYMNEKRDASFNLKTFAKQNLESIQYSLTDKKVNKLLLNSSAFQAGFKSINDYIQPIIISISMGVILFSGYTLAENMKIYIGVIYAVIYLLSSFASKYAHVFQKKFEAKGLVNLLWLLTGGILIFLSFFLHSILVVFIVFALLYIFQNIRRPIMVDLIGDATVESKRASVMSVESQGKSLVLAIFAPAIGFLADYNMQLMFLIFGSLLIFVFLLTKIKFPKKTESI